MRYSFSRAIAIDDNNDMYHYLVLFSALTPTVNKLHYHYSYGFTVHNKDWYVTTGPLYNRGDAAKYLPLDLYGKIIPLVLDMTKNLIKRINPPRIIRETMEALEGNSLKRYDKITDLLINELGYRMEKEGVTPEGKNYWIMTNGDGKNVTIDESYELNNSEKRRIMMQDHIRSVMNEDWARGMRERYNTKNRGNQQS